MSSYDTTTIKGRLYEYVRIQEKSGIRDFERRMGFSEGMISRPGGFSIESLVKLATRCPALSLRWLLTGQGQMLQEGTTNIENNGTAGQIADRINNFGDIHNYETFCEEIKQLTKILNDLQTEKEELRKENSRLIGVIEGLVRKN